MISRFLINKDYVGKYHSYTNKSSATPRAHSVQALPSFDRQREIFADEVSRVISNYRHWAKLFREDSIIPLLC